MAEDSIITDEMKQIINVESESSVYEIEKEPIRRWAESIGDSNPLYHDEEYARECEYYSLVAPPGFIAQYAFPIKRGKPVILPEPKRAFKNRLNGGTEYEFFKPIQAGDVITAKTKFIDIRERKGRLGPMLITVRETTYKNKKGEIVAKLRGTGISY
jgi:acyl dehydratase